MPRPLTAAALALVLLIGACSDSAADTTTTVVTAPPLTTTTAPLPATTSGPTSSTGTTSPSSTTSPSTSTTTTTSIAGVAGAAGVGDPYFPLLGNGGYDVDHYTIELDIDPVANVIVGITTIEAVATETLSSFNLDFFGLDVEAVEVDGAPADFTRSSTELTVTPAALLPAGEDFVAAVRYFGTPTPRTVSGLGLRLGWQHQGETTYVVSEPNGAQTWYPANDHPSDKATYAFRLTVPQGHVAAANGVLVDTFDEPAGTTFVWEMDQPMASYLATVVVAEQAREDSVAPNGLPIRNYFPVGLADGPELFARTGEMVVFFEDLLGPYPFDEYGVVVAGDIPGALETQSLSIFGTPIVGLPQDIVDLIAAHELAHQWFGDSVSPATWQDTWLNEGFATYFEALWLEHRDGPDGYEARIRDHYEIVAQAEFTGPANTGAEDFLGAGVYLRGGLTLHALRVELGDDAFFGLLRTYYERFAYGNASTADFIAVAEEVAGRELDDLFDAWLVEPAVPPLP